MMIPTKFKGWSKVESNRKSGLMSFQQNFVWCRIFIYNLLLSVLRSLLRAGCMSVIAIYFGLKVMVTFCTLPKLGKRCWSNRKANKVSDCQCKSNTVLSQRTFSKHKQKLKEVLYISTSTLVTQRQQNNFRMSGS